MKAVFDVSIFNLFLIYCFKSSLSIIGKYLDKINCILYISFFGYKISMYSFPKNSYKIKFTYLTFVKGIYLYFFYIFSEN